MSLYASCRSAEPAFRLYLRPRSELIDSTSEGTSRMSRGQAWLSWSIQKVITSAWEGPMPVASIMSRGQQRQSTQRVCAMHGHSCHRQRLTGVVEDSTVRFDTRLCIGWYRPDAKTFIAVFIIARPGPDSRDIMPDTKVVISLDLEERSQSS